MARILISPIGVGGSNYKMIGMERKYRKTTYRFPSSNQNYETSFIAAALSEHLKVDQIILIGTKKSMWEDVYNYFQTKSGQEIDLDYYVSLGDKIENSTESICLSEEDLIPVNQAIDHYLQKKGSSCIRGSYCKIIEYGLNEEQLQRNLAIFMEIGESLKEGDEIYLDITHSFRSIPFFMYMMIDFIRHLRIKENIKLSGIFYGMLEASNELGYTPIVDLSSLYDIAEWTKGAANFINYGNGYQMANLVTDDLLSNHLNNISNLLNMNNIKDLKREIDRLNHYFQQDEIEQSPYFQYLQPHIQLFILRFKGISTDAEFQYKLAEWYFENKRYANGYICLAESIVSRVIYFYQKAGQNVNVRNVGHRNIIKFLLRNDEYRKYIHLNISSIYHEISKIRNNIAHAGFTDNNDFQQHIASAHKYIDQVRKLFFTNSTLQNIPNKLPFQQLIQDRKKEKIPY